MQQSVWCGYSHYTGAALRVLPKADLRFVAYMDGGKGREQDAQALLGFDLVH
ncbi:MAG: hypothetical protein ACPG5Z_16545 [Pseudoalteromonas sp.]